jgi:hypothetical protein
MEVKMRICFFEKDRRIESGNEARDKNYYWNKKSF